ncbi:hypothetical protein [Acidithiobacillus sp.]|jgi:hypothetical protein|uniref:hypothetical protein n=1 Tax=Acidithiobacillus sp. TaxID=1872118 RepID=UPI0025C2CB83|nr:hypothetical protein [Acidithiobacillus sp.]
MRISEHQLGSNTIVDMGATQVVISHKATVPCAEVLVDDDDFSCSVKNVTRVINTLGHTQGSPNWGKESQRDENRCASGGRFTTDGIFPADVIQVY